VGPDPARLVAESRFAITVYQHLSRSPTACSVGVQFISIWRGRPPTSQRTNIELVSATTSKTGLIIQAGNDHTEIPQES